MHKKSQKLFVFLNRALVILLILAQVGVFIYLINSTSKLSVWITYGLRLISLLVVLHIISVREKSGFKMTWIILVMIFPIFGGVTYLIFHLQASTLYFKREIRKLEFSTRSELFLLESKTAQDLAQNSLQDSSQNSKEDLSSSLYLEALEKNPDFASNIFYLQQTAGFPVFDSTKTTYLSPGENYYSELLKQLKKAEKYIFIESFIIDDGIMWNGIYEILKEKAEKGLDVRVIYDDVGSFLLHSHDFRKQMREFGIKCCVFNRFKPFFLVSLNHRDHRKIVAIDGKVAFTGGINIADEYINARERFGYWKDAAVMLEGKAAWSLAVIFLQLWDFTMRITENVCDFMPNFTLQTENENENGFVQPFADSPTDDENVSEHVYLHTINNAKDYLFIETPYFIVDDSFISALILAAKSGVDVRLVFPYKWDKRLIKQISKSYYSELIHGGVRIFEYLPGFIHSKVFLADEKIAVVGSVNLDYRSLYHHFECATCLYNTSSIKELRLDFEQTFLDCKEIHLEDCKGNIFKRFWQSVLRIIAPIL